MRILSTRNLTRTISLLLLILASSPCRAFDLFDYIGGHLNFKTDTLSYAEVSSLRVREIKRRLARTHGFGADELGRMLDKKDLVEALAFEEHKIRQTELQGIKRDLTWKAIFATIAAGLITLFWPLLKHLYEVAHVNFGT